MNRFQVIPAAYLLLLRGNGPDLEVLLQRRGPALAFMPGRWATAAAGHVELGESVFAAAAREAREELGVEVALRDVVPLCAMQRTLPGVTDPVEQRVDYFLTARRWNGRPEVREPDKATEVGWFRPAAPPEPMVPHEAHLLRVLAEATTTGVRVPAILTFGF